MSNVVDFKLRVYDVLFNLPEQKIIHIDKRGSDQVAIVIDGDSGTATLKSTTKASAANKLKTIFPDCTIVDVIVK